MDGSQWDPVIDGPRRDPADAVPAAAPVAQPTPGQPGGMVWRTPDPAPSSAPQDIVRADAPTKQKRSVLKRGPRVGVGVVVALVLTLGGTAVRTWREASASPGDLAACGSMMTFLETRGRNGVEPLSKLGSADDATLREQAAPLAAAARSGNDDALVTRLNNVVGRCQEISPDFRERFDGYCRKNADMCEDRFDLF